MTNTMIPTKNGKWVDVRTNSVNNMIELSVNGESVWLTPLEAWKLRRALGEK